ncbi:hypothetical protein [Flagellimonas meridianipacifica]|uniref:Uncharacterized protein n=1 Tax=Flagellimonas meridianipacifica TaxID=1080225 RepID=A0A2T0MAK3_9FLAO|nr:hypothetical protein [Allomuricauda pacifica]PRX54537.1 hypothetical protein CLV81_2938 [Allomuricauda pacifica]
MRPDKKRDSLFPLSDITTFVTCNGLEDFLKVLERDFFAEISAQCRYNIKKQQIDIVLDIHCNFGLTESLHHFNSGNWGGISPQNEGCNIPSKFDESFQKLCADNNHALDIAELSLHFKDTSVIVNRIHDYSIPEELPGIMSKLSENFVYFTKGLTEMPYEIFVPVFEDTDQGAISAEGHRDQYYDFWGLYFDDKLNHDVMIYEVKNRELTNEDFFLLD